MHLHNTCMRKILWSTILFQHHRNLLDRATKQQTGLHADRFSKTTTASTYTYTHGFDMHNFGTVMEEMHLHCLSPFYRNQFLLQFTNNTSLQIKTCFLR
jgi:hypothetical protein